MDIMNCPECGELTVRAGLAFWPELDEPVLVIECASPSCGWAGIDTELVVTVSEHAVSSAA